MADISKDGIVSMLGNILGDDKKEAVDSLVNSFGGNSNASSSSQDLSGLIDTAEIMGKMTKVMDKLNHSRDNREFALLTAMRPYMRDERKNKLDTCLKMIQVVSVINEMKKEG